MKNKKRFCSAKGLLTMFFMFLSALAFSQTKTISGTVVDGEGIAIIGASVLEKGTSNGTITDFDGHFSLSVKSNTTVVVSYIGMSSQEINVSGKNKLNVTLQDDAQTLDEVVVVGYGTVKKRDLTGAVSRINAENIGQRPIARVESALQGAMPGVSVRNVSGEPGSDMQIRVRGAASINASADPLYIIDGVPSKSLVALNPSDIASMEVLKDAASAAIYGSRGSNGVIIVTTKKGQSGKAKVGIDISYGLQQVAKKIDLLSGEEWIENNIRAIDIRYLQTVGSVGSIADNTTVRMQKLGITTLNTNYILDDRWQYYVNQSTRDNHNFEQTEGKLAMLDWQDAMYRVAPMQDYNINISGGTDDVNYLFSIGYFNQDGIVVGTNYKRLTARANIDAKINKWLSAGVKLAPTYSISDGAGLANGKDKATHWILQMVPVSNAEAGYKTNSDPYEKYLWAMQSANPVEFMKQSTATNYSMRVYGQIYLRLNPIKGLQIEGTASGNYYDKDGKYYEPSSTAWVWKSPGLSSAGGHNTERRFDNVLYQVVANYNRTFGKHSVAVMAGASNEMNNWGYATNQTYSQPFPNDAIQGSFNGSVLTPNANTVTEKTPNRLISYFGRANYDFGGKYLLSASLRYDGGSVFGVNNRWGAFPAVSGAWRISEEKFFQNLNVSDIFSQVKFRASYGITGNNDISSTATYALLSSTMYADQIGYRPSSLPNQDLGWEKTKSTDIALDISLFKNQIQLSADWYTKKTTNLLYYVPIPRASGYSSYLSNLGDVKNHGFEIDLTTHNVSNKNFKWTTSFNYSFNKTKVLSLGIDDTPVYSGFQSGNPSNVLEVGRSMNVFYMYDAIGVWKTQAEIEDFAVKNNVTNVTFNGTTIKPGDIRYRDVNGDGIFTTADKDYLGDPQPRNFFGMTNTFEFKNFDLSILMTAQTGGKILGLYGRAIDRPGMGTTLNATGNWRNAWWSETEQGDGKTPYLLSTTTGGNIDSRWLYSSDNLAIKNLTVGYKLPFKTNVVQYARLYLSIENLAHFNNYPGYSVEAANTGQSGAPGGATSLGIDYGGYPLARTYTFGLNITF